MPAIKVSQKKIEALLRQEHPTQTDYRDILTQGLVFRIGPRGAVWNYLRRIDGKLCRLKLGDWPGVGIADARQEVGRIEETIAAGKHPKAEQARQRAEQRTSRDRDQKRLFEKLAEEWQRHHFDGLAESTRVNYAYLLARIVEAFRGHDAADITRGDLIRFLDAQRQVSASGANQAASIIRQMFQYALDRYDLPANPAVGLKNPTKPLKRSRTLDRAEIRILWRACELAGYPYGHALRLALCTGQRIGEIGMIRWADIEGDYWRNTENKSKQRIDIYLATHATAIVKDCPRINAYVFTSGRAAPDKESSGIRSDTWGGGTSGAMHRHIWPRIETAAQQLGADPIAEHFTPHDLRRTVRTGLTGWAGVLPDAAERVLNHSISGLRAHYDFADYRPHVTEALQRWDAELARILAGEQAAVLPLRSESA